MFSDMSISLTQHYANLVQCNVVSGQLQHCF